MAARSSYPDPYPSRQIRPRILPARPSLVSARLYRLTGESVSESVSYVVNTRNDRCCRLPRSLLEFRSILFIFGVL